MLSKYSKLKNLFNGYLRKGIAKIQSKPIVMPSDLFLFSSEKKIFQRLQTMMYLIITPNIF